MTKEDIFQSGFISNFIIEYYEKQIHSYYPDKDRLLYVFCDNEEEKQNVSKEQIKIIKAKISDLGFEELSFSYLLSCKPESLHNFIKSENRFEFWVKRFAEEFDYNFESFDPITQGICNFNDVSELTIEAMENEDSFWELYPKNSKPQTQDFVTIIPNETDIISLVQYDIELFNKNTYWEFDFDDYHKYINVSKPLEILFNLSELLVQLNRLEMFKSLLQQESIEDKVNVLQKPKFTVFETIMKELNFVAWVFECQVSDVSYNSLPVIHQKGRYLPNVISVQSNIQMLKIQDYFQHYTERFERANDKTVISNELVEIYKRAKQIMSFYDENLHSDSDVATSYFEKLPNDFKNKIDYNKKHTALIVVDDLQIFDIYFEVGDLTFNVKDKNYYDENRYKISYLTDNSELLRFCQKLIDFVGKFPLHLADVLEPEKLEYLKRLCEISIDYSKDGNWSVGNLPIEFESITKVDLFIEYFIKSIQTHIDDGRSVNGFQIMIDLLIQKTKTDIENPLKERSVNTNRHLLNKLEEVKIFFSDAKALPSQKATETITQKQFSVLEWATIFYYADETKLLPDNQILKNRFEQFISKHQLTTTYDNFKTKYYDAKKRINKTNDYPISKLQLIIPFLKTNYKQTVTKVENDITYLEENKLDY